MTENGITSVQLFRQRHFKRKINFFTHFLQILPPKKCILAVGIFSVHHRSSHKWNRDSSPTRQFTDKVFEDSSPRELKTVHGHF